MSKKNKEGITAKKEENFSEWFTQIIKKADLADYSPVSGAIIIKPNGYAIWEKIQSFFDNLIKNIGVKNAYFPLLIPESLLNKEKDHVEGFSPEVAWVTHAGSTKLKERLAIRPTSETIMYPAYSTWIRSHNDLPLLINQWNNVVRWEFKHPVPFLRTREFLWQEGHSALATKEESEKHNKVILEFYKKVYEDLMAIPVLKGKKTDKEKFAGADYTESVEIFLPNGKAIQGATSHCLGQNFSRVFDITFLDKQGKKKFAWQNSWGLSTRSIGIMIMIHSDNKGLIIPPKLANEKIVIIPILFDKTKEKVLKETNKVKKELSKFNAFIDDREDYTPGWKFNEWELKGIPLRIEIGPKDLEKKSVIVVKRNDNKKLIIKTKDLNKKIPEILEEMQNELYKKAEKHLKSSITEATTMEELNKAVKNKKIALTPMCKNPECENYVKEKTSGAKTLNISEKQPSLKNKKCVWCKKQADYWVYIAKSY